MFRFCFDARNRPLAIITTIIVHSPKRWPNAIVLPGAAGRGATAGKAGFHKLQKNLSEDFPSGSPRYGMLASVRPLVHVVVVVFELLNERKREEGFGKKTKSVNGAASRCRVTVKFAGTRVGGFRGHRPIPVVCFDHVDLCGTHTPVVEAPPATSVAASLSSRTSPAMESLPPSAAARRFSEESSCLSVGVGWSVGGGASSPAPESEELASPAASSSPLPAEGACPLTPPARGLVVVGSLRG